MEVISANIKVSQQKDYCMICRKWVNECVNHKCPIKHRALIDENMAGIVDRLYNLGIVPMMAMFNLDSSGKSPQTHHVTIHIALRKGFSCEILGHLPVGWEYHWNEHRVHTLEFTDCQYYLDIESAEHRLSEIINEFEEFLNSKDAEGVKSLLLLTGCQ